MEENGYRLRGYYDRSDVQRNIGGFIQVGEKSISGSICELFGEDPDNPFRIGPDVLIAGTTINDKVEGGRVLNFYTTTQFAYFPAPVYFSMVGALEYSIQGTYYGKALVLPEKLVERLKFEKRNRQLVLMAEMQRLLKHPTIFRGAMPVEFTLQHEYRKVLREVC